MRDTQETIKANMEYPTSREQDLLDNIAALEGQVAELAEAAQEVALPITCDGSVEYCETCKEPVPCQCVTQHLRHVLAHLPEAANHLLAKGDA